MTRLPGDRAARRACRWVLRRLQGGREDGFILLESMIAITIITVVMSAVGAEFLSTTVAASQLRAQQVAVQVADSTVEQIRSLDPSDLLTGRGSSAVSTQFAAATPKVQPWLANMDQALDSTAAAGSGIAAAVPTCGNTVLATTCQLTPGNVTYTVNQYLGWCSVVTGGSAPAECLKSSTVSGAATRYLRAVVAVTWTGRRCGASTTTCSYVTSTLVSATADPTFRINAAPYSAPVVVAPGSQSNVIADAVSLQMSVQNGTGVPSFTWAKTAGSFPGGLSISTTGLISGTVQAPAGTYSATVQVTDSFLRTDTQVISWTVRPALALTDPGPQATIVNQATSLTLTATGGEGAPYTFSILNSSLPPGLSLASATGVISGKPTTVGSYTVQVKVFDKSNVRYDLEQFTWTVGYPPIAASNPGRQVDTVNTVITPLQLTASGGSGNYVWSDPSGTLPAGLSLSSGGVVSGAATALTAGSGASVVLKVSDPTAGYSTTVSFVWSIVAKPTVAAPAPSSTVTLGQSLSFAVSTTCPNSPCTYTLNNGPSGFTANSAGVFSGTVGGTATTYSNATITVTDSDGATGTSAPFVVIVKAQPTVSGSAQSDTLGDSVSVALTTTCPNSPCSYTLNNGPTGLSVTAAGVITGTVGGTAKTYSAVTVTVTDSAGVSNSSASFPWVVYAQPSLSGVTAMAIGETATPSIPISYSCPAAPCTLTFSGTLASSSVGIGLSTSPVNASSNSTRSVTVSATSGTVYLNGLVSATAVTTGTSRAYGVSLDITDTNGISPADSTTTYTAYSTPTISTPGPVSTTQNGTPSKSLTYYCPGTCTVAVSGLPTGVGLSTGGNTSANGTTSRNVSGSSGTLYLNGRVSGTAAKTTYQVTVTITYGNTVITSSGIWTVS